MAVAAKLRTTAAALVGHAQNVLLRRRACVYLQITLLNLKRKVNKCCMSLRSIRNQPLAVALHLHVLTGQCSLKNRLSCVCGITLYLKVFTRKMGYFE